MRALLFVAFGLTGCSTMSLRVGAVMFGGTPAFQASLEVGTSVGSKRLYEVTHEHGTQADATGVTYFNALNADIVTLDSHDRPLVRLGPRMRATMNHGASLGARATFYTGMLRDAKTHSGGLGFELGGGVPIEGAEPVIEASLVATGRWKID